MKTYRLTEDWLTFQRFIIDNLDSDNQNEIGIMHRDNDIFIRTINISTLRIIKKKYELIPCKQPNYLLDKDPHWGFFGNKNLFDVIPLE